jgi:hypothetical protein
LEGARVCVCLWVVLWSVFLGQAKKSSQKVGPVCKTGGVVLVNDVGAAATALGGWVKNRARAAWLRVCVCDEVVVIKKREVASRGVAFLSLGLGFAEICVRQEASRGGWRLGGRGQRGHEGDKGGAYFARGAGAWVAGREGHPKTAEVEMGALEERREQKREAECCVGLDALRPLFLCRRLPLCFAS